jgi:hypothetical protein
MVLITDRMDSLTKMNKTAEASRDAAEPNEHCNRFISSSWRVITNTHITK